VSVLLLVLGSALVASFAAMLAPQPYTVPVVPLLLGALGVGLGALILYVSGRGDDS
jgi:hypothetical protein